MQKFPPVVQWNLPRPVFVSRTPVTVLQMNKKRFLHSWWRSTVFLPVPLSPLFVFLLPRYHRRRKKTNETTASTLRLSTEAQSTSLRNSLSALRPWLQLAVSLIITSFRCSLSSTPLASLSSASPKHTHTAEWATMLHNYVFNILKTSGQKRVGQRGLPISNKYIKKKWKKRKKCYLWWREWVLDWIENDCFLGFFCVDRKLKIRVDGSRNSISEIVS